MLWEKTKITATRESLTGDSIMLRKQYPEWELQVRIPIFENVEMLIDAAFVENTGQIF